MKYLITKWVGDKKIESFLVSLPEVRESGHYQAGVSLSCFENRELFRCFGPKAKPEARKGIRFSVDNEENQRFNKESEERMKEKFPDFPFLQVPVTEVESIWEFYKLIGYNYKTQKYVQETNSTV